MSVDPRLLAPLLQALRSSEVAIVVIVDRDGRLERPYFNETCAAMLGYSAAELAALPALSAVVDQTEVMAELRSRVSGRGDVPPVFETSLRHRDGRRIPVEVVSHPLEMEGGQAYVIVFRSLLPRHQTQLSLLEADRISLIGALAAGMAHEIKNPLTGMLLALRVLRRTLLDELPEPSRSAALRAIDDSISSGERVTSNVSALLSLAATGKSRAVDLGTVTSAALRLVSPMLEDRARVVREIHAVPGIHGDEARLGQAVLSMLLFSSSGFRGDDPRDNRIVVRVLPMESGVCVEISDNGSALSTKELTRAFDPFFVSRGRGAGLGVGLGVARSIATAHGGTLEMAAQATGLMTKMCLPLGRRVASDG